MFLIFPVHGQKIESVKQNVVDVLGKSVQFRWKVNRGFENITIIALDVYNDTVSSKYSRLFSSFNDAPVKHANTPDRVTAKVEGSFSNDVEVIYKIIMENVQFIDVGTSVVLEAIFRRPIVFSSAKVTLIKVKGMYFDFALLDFYYCDLPRMKFF